MVGAENRSTELTTKSSASIALKSQWHWGEGYKKYDKKDNAEYLALTVKRSKLVCRGRVSESKKQEQYGKYHPARIHEYSDYTEKEDTYTINNTAFSA